VIVTDTSSKALMAKGLTEHDAAEVQNFARFLSEVGPAPDPSPRTIQSGKPHRYPPGWFPYMLGFGPPPPEGLQHLPVTAWTLPG
jgi:hypothetical protein